MNHQTTVFPCKGEELLLLPEKAIFWKSTSWLIVSDVHLGKSAHFRKAGIPLPLGHTAHDLEALDRLIAEHAPALLLFLGDLFHSRLNADWQAFSAWRMKHEDLQMTLIRGNHDVISPSRYAEIHIQVLNELRLAPFHFLHEPPSIPISGAYSLAGHLHPGLLLEGRGRLRERLPCFHFYKSGAVLPAFGSFTGLSSVRCGSEDAVFVVAGGEVLHFAGPEEL